MAPQDSLEFLRSTASGDGQCDRLLKPSVHIAGSFFDRHSAAPAASAAHYHLSGTLDGLFQLLIRGLKRIGRSDGFF
jgi:hypothetical protein